MDDATLAAAEEALGYSFSDPALLEQALTHASVTDTRHDSNERLEFLGDAVLGMIVCERLYHEFPDLLEGELTKIKSDVVSRRTCAQIADDLRLTEFLSIGKGMQGQGDLPASISAALLESVIGAVYLDAGDAAAGMTACKRLLEPLLAPIIERTAESGHQQNFKSVLQQHVQDEMGMTPSYILLDEKGPDHAKCFEVCVQIGAERHESAWGQSKKQAEQQAALNALCKLGLVCRNTDGDVAIIEADASAAE